MIVRQAIYKDFEKEKTLRQAITTSLVFFQAFMLK
jgi:hypothetical protein